MFIIFEDRPSDCPFVDRTRTNYSCEGAVVVFVQDDMICGR